MLASRMRFDASGRLTDFGMDRDVREVVVDSGKPFQTSGCPGMTTRFPPAIVPLVGDIRSFPFAFNARDVALVRRQIQGVDVNIFDEEASKNEAITPCFRESVAGA